MFKLLMIVASVVVVMGAPQGPTPYYPRGAPGNYVPIVDQFFDLNPIDNSYSFGYQSADGSARREEGGLKNQGTPVEALSVTGSYNYVDSDGQVVTVNYIADENGFQPIGSNIHPAISKAAQDQALKARNEPPYVYDPRQDY